MFGEYRRIIISLPCIGILVWAGEGMFGEYRRIIISLPCIGILVWAGEVHVRGVPKNNNFPALYRYFSMGGRSACSGSTEE